MPDETMAPVTEPITPEPAAVEPVETEDTPLAAAGEKALEAFKKRAREAEAQAKELAAKVQSFEDRDKTEQERLADEVEKARAEVEAARAEAQTARVEADRVRIGSELNLPLEVADRIQGSSYDEMLEDGKKLAVWAKPAAATDFDGGSRTVAKSPDRDEIVRLMKDDPTEFNRRMEAGEISSDALAA